MARHGGEVIIHVPLGVPRREQCAIANIECHRATSEDRSLPAHLESIEVSGDTPVAFQVRRWDNHHIAICCHVRSPGIGISLEKNFIADIGGVKGRYLCHTIFPCTGFQETTLQSDTP